MKNVISLMFVSALLVSACTTSPQDNIVAPTTVAPTYAVNSYRCQSGETITTTYPDTESATIVYQGSSYDMKIAVSASGSRYVGGEFEWWTKVTGPKSEGTLFRHMTDGTTGESIELCTNL